jgi:hypothetical protein
VIAYLRETLLTIDKDVDDRGKGKMHLVPFTGISGHEFCFLSGMKLERQ